MPSSHDTLLPPSEASRNQPEFSVSEISRVLKRTIEDAFGYVRIRGEISGCKLAPSGHLYFALKDESAVLAAICWRGTVQKLPFKPTDGLEVVCSGHLTTYAGQSKYQLIVEAMQPAGEGALMALLEKRKKQLAQEGLFDNTRKKPLPFFPTVIGVVTSPTGAVIRDILHRLRDRFPCHVLLWPVLVQGEQAAGQIAAAIAGFNALPDNGPIPRPDVLIVARGGGSLEDLWAFNEEIVVRAAAASAIPLISAVGHETDTTLIDYASDRRAPTPTAAAEIATPVINELWVMLSDSNQRIMHGATRLLEERHSKLSGLARGLPNPLLLLEQAIQRVDDISARLPQALLRLVELKQKHVGSIAAALPHPRHRVEQDRQKLAFIMVALRQSLLPAVNEKHYLLAVLTARLDYKPIQKDIARFAEKLPSLDAACQGNMLKMLEQRHLVLINAAKLLESYHYTKVLGRGFALIWDSEHKPVTSAQSITKGTVLRIELKDGTRTVIASDARPATVRRSRKKPTGQGTLL